MREEKPLESTLEVTRARSRTGDSLLVAGPRHLSTHKLAKDTIVIGRAPDCDVVVDHRAFSRRHAVVRTLPALTIQDLGSTNGTRTAAGVLHGGEAVALEAGESFYIGPFSLMVVPSKPTGEATPDRDSADRLVVDDPTAAGVSTLVREIARSAASVLIQGETGVGKDVLASTIHALSGRSGPLCRINCAALSESLLESELFGHEKGAFTGAVAARAGLFEAAAGGSVFLDEIGELPLAIQAKLLRAVEAREVVRLGSTRPIAIDVRFISATNRDLPVEVSAGRFRHDLYFRLDGVSLRIPPLRERRGAIARLALGFIDEVSRRTGRTAGVDPSLVSALEAYDWPGNVRELKAVIERAVLLASGSSLAAHHLAFSPRAEAGPPPVRAASPAPAAPLAAAIPTPPIATPAAPPAAAPADDTDLSFLSVEQREDRERIVAALHQCVGNQTRAAKLLGISRTTLINRITLYRIPRPRT